MTAAKNGHHADHRGAAHRTATRALYAPLDFVVLRVPLLPREFYDSMSRSSFDDKSLDEFFSNEQILSAIQAASPDLVRALLSPATNEGDRSRAKRKLRRYLIRMSTRPTPFGAFAGVAIAPLGERTTLHLNESEARHSRHLDVPWLLEFAHKLESDPDIFRQLKLQANSCALVRGGRVYIRELNPLCKDGKTVKNASLKASNTVLRALEAAKSPIAYQDLFLSLAGSSRANEQKIQRFITELWQQEFLLTELRPPFTNGDPLPFLRERLNRLGGAEPYRFELERQSSMAYDEPLRKPVSAPQPGRSAPEDADEARPRIHIDSAFSLSGALNAAVAREAARAAEILLSLSPCPAGLPYVTAYRQVFEERYGTEREVPLLEMIDPEYGIGVPPTYERKKSPPNTEQPPEQRIRRETLFDIALAASCERRLEADLDEETLQRLRTCTPGPENVPNSLDIYVFAVADTMRDLDEGRFSVVVGPNVGAMEAGRNLGRFAESLGPDGTNAFRDAARALESVSPGKTCVELNYLPRNLQLTNILARPTAREFEINVGVQAGVPLQNAIPISDLVVGVRGGRFYVKSIGLNRHLHICSGHMANIDFAPSICRVLTDLMLDEVTMLRELDWGAAFMFPFLPRVRAGRVVLSVARWRITAATVKRQFRLDSTEAFRASLSRWRAEWNVPRHVYLAEADNRLVLDLENEMDSEDLRGELRQVSKNGAILLEEVYPDVADAWLPGSSGRYVAECAVPLVLNPRKRDEPAPDTETSVVKTISAAPEATAAGRVKPPGSDWLYLKLYTAPSIEDDLLTGTIRELVGWARESGVIQRWFFVRYADPQPHIRLRFQGAPQALMGSLLPKAAEWAQQLVKEDLCLRFAIDTYEPEIDRYGGIDAIVLAEELFCLDSESALALLPFAANRSLRLVELAVFGLNSLFDRLGCSSAQKHDLFKGFNVPRKDSGEVYRERKGILHALVGLRCDSSLAKMVGEMSCAIEPNATAIEDVGWRLRALDQAGRLVPRLDIVYKSFAHMHCNRLGLDAAAERLAYGLLTRSYDALQALSSKQIPSPRPSADTACGRNDD